jgi:hypothetical protein
MTIVEIRHFIKVFAQSLRAILIISFYRFYKKSDFEKILRLRFSKVNIICPGPSCKNFRKINFKEDEAYIFINHGLIVSNYVSKNKFFISADGTRVSEVMKSHPGEYDSLFSIITPEHFRHLTLEIIKNTNLVFLSNHLRLSKNHGIVAKNLGPDGFRPLNLRPSPTGFGSMICALQLAVSFSPKEIILHGCDIGETGGVRYFDSSVPIREFEAFELTKKHFSVVKKMIVEARISI